MNKRIHAIALLSLVATFAVPMGSLQAAGSGEKVGKKWYTIASDYCTDLYTKVSSGLGYQKKRDNAVRGANTKEEAYDAGFSNGVEAAVDQSTFDDYKEVRDDLQVVHENKGKIEGQGRQLGEIDRKVSKNTFQSGENKGAIKEQGNRIDDHDRRIKNVEDGRKALNALLSVRGGMVTSSMGIAAGQINKIAPSLANPIIQSAGSIALGIGITALAIQGFCIWPDKMAAKLGHLSKFGFNYGWYLGQGLGYAAATASVLGGAYIVHKSVQKQDSSGK